MIHGAVEERDVKVRQRTQRLEARFCELYMEKARLEDQARQIHDELMRLQGAIRELTLPDQGVSGENGDTR